MVMRISVVVFASMSLAACDNRTQAQKDYDNAMVVFNQDLQQSEREIGAIKSGDTLTMTCLENAKSHKERRECTER